MFLLVWLVERVILWQITLALASVLLDTMDQSVKIITRLVIMCLVKTEEIVQLTPMAHSAVLVYYTPLVLCVLAILELVMVSILVKTGEIAQQLMVLLLVIVFRVTKIPLVQQSLIIVTETLPVILTEFV
jgi:hypothetical protein